jgi:hypothetical protein
LTAPSNNERRTSPESDSEGWSEITSDRHASRLLKDKKCVTRRFYLKIVVYIDKEEEEEENERQTETCSHT